MDDLGRALAGGREMMMLGGGNPALIPEVQQFFRRSMHEMLENEDEFERAIGIYDAPQGNAEFIAALADLLRKEFEWPIAPQNIALTNGSQSAFFTLFNMLGGEFEDGTYRKILLPLCPEYIGYVDVGIQDDLFVSYRPRIEHFEGGLFKYRVDFDALEVGDDVGAICVSRPTNPTGNVLSDEEIAKLSRIARDRDIPLIVDSAYGAPFPNIIFTEATPTWDDHVIYCLSLSKLGLPAARTGIIVSNEKVVNAVAGMNAVMNLSPNKMGAAIATRLIRSGEILPLSRKVIMPYYRRKADAAVAQLREELEGCDFHIHKPEGALFLWLWFRDLPITSQQLYERLKDRGVLVVSGHHFFPGLEKDDWRHRHECLRVSYAQAEETVSRGLAIIAEEVRRAYSGQVHAGSSA